MFHKIHHVAIICSKYEVSKEFYTQTLGLKIIHETYREARKSFKLDLEINNGEQIELFSFPNPPQRPSYPESCGLRHLALCVEDIEKTIDYLKLKNVFCEAIRVDEFTGKRFTFFADPDHLPIELVEM